MKRLIAMVMGACLLPVAAFASHESGNVNVDVRVGGGTGWFDDSAWVEFRPDRGAYIALYAVFSDGSIDLVFPDESCESHWVDGFEARSVQVFAPCGVSLDHVQAVASSRWFDPAECWVAWSDGADWVEPRVYVAAAAPVVCWDFQVAWYAPRHAWSVVRRCSWDGYRDWNGAGMPMLSAARWKEPLPDAAGGRWKEAPSGQEGRGDNQKWVVSGRNGVAHPNVVRSTAGGGGKEKVKSHPASGAKSSVPSRKTGEPERRSGR